MLTAAKKAQDSDVTFPNPPSDSISCLAVNGFNNAPTNMLIAGSWDNTLSMYEIQYSGQSVSNVIRHNQLLHDGPVLCCDISPDGMTTFSAGADGNIRMWNASQPVASSQIIGKHDLPVKNMRFLPESNILVTGSWDKSVRLWDCRQPNPAAVLPLTERCYGMDAKGQIIIVGTADKKIIAYQLQNKIAEYNSPLTHQIRCISVFHDNQGFAVGSIEGRVALEYYNEMNQKMQLQQKPNATKPNFQSFAYKCHRDTKDVYSVNCIDFHPYNTFVSAGSDGILHTWDKNNRARLSTFDKFSGQAPVTAVQFSPSGSSLFYALSYDWSRGAENNSNKIPTQILMHVMQEAEIAPKKK